MSTNPPPIPQGAPGQPYPPYPVQKKTNPIVWVLLGLGVFFLLVVIAIAGAGFFLMHKVKQAGIDTDLMKRNPAAATIKVMAALNPNIEVLSMDDNKGVVTVRDKKDGKTYTVNFEDAKKGKFTFQEDGQKPVTITAGGDNSNSSVVVNSDQGTVKIGSGADAKVPTWVPEYPGSTPQGVFSAQTKDGNTGSYQFKTKDSVDQVTKFYQDGFKSMGLKTSSTLTNADGKNSGGMVNGEMPGKSAIVLMGTEGGDTTVNVTFKSNK